MIGAVAFVVVLAFTTGLSWLWASGKLPEFIEEQRIKCENSIGRTFHLSIGRWKPSIKVDRTFWVRVAFIVLGPAAVIGLSIAYAEILPLRIVFAIYVLPAYLAMIVLGIIYPEYGKKALFGFSMGFVATVIYDLVRMFITIGMGLPDPIPHIGALWIGPDAIGDQWWVGYLWRLFGNGAGLGIVYAMLPRWWFNLKGGWLYGDAVGLGMFATLFISVAAQIHLFPLNFIVLVNGILGHWAYGLALGWLFMQKKAKELFKIE